MTNTERKCMWCDNIASIKGQFIENGLFFQSCIKHMIQFLLLFKENLP